MAWIRITGKLEPGIKYVGIPEEEFEQLQAELEKLKEKLEWIVVECKGDYVPGFTLERIKKVAEKP